MDSAGADCGRNGRRMMRTAAKINTEFLYMASLKDD